MSAPSPHEFLAALRQTQLLPPAQLEAAQQEAGPAGDTKGLADRLVQRGWLTAFQRDMLLAGHAAHLALDKYRLLEPIAEGGMGVVYKARDIRLNRLAALKLIRPEVLGNNPDALRRFQREAEAVGKLSHPNVVVVYDIGEVADVHYMAMEYVDGVDLERMVYERGELPIEQACDYVRQAAEGLQHAHEHGLVHRDIKPSNLLVTRPSGSGPRRSGGVLPRPSLAGLAQGLPPEQLQASVATAPRGIGSTPYGLVKILDMGLARWAELDEGPKHGTHLTRQGTVLGTPDYMAPEQARDPSRVDIRADLYSLGCTLYFLLTGRVPFADAATTVDKILRHQNARPLSVLAIRPQTPPAVAAVVERLMAKDRDERYQEPEQVVEDLTRIAGAAAASLSGVAMPMAATPTYVGGPTRNEALTVRPKTPTPPGGVTQQVQLDTLILPPRKVVTLEGHRGVTMALAFPPGGELLATGGVDDCVRLWGLGGPEPVERGCLREQLGEVQALAFAPTEPYLITGPSGTSGGKLWRWDFAEKGARERSRLPDAPSSVAALAFSLDGQRLAAGGYRSLVVWSASKQGLVRYLALRLPDGAVKAVAFSPDGKQLAAGGEDCAVRVWQFGRWRTSEQVLSGHSDTVNSVAFAPDGKLLASACSDRTIRLWDAASGAAAVATLAGHKNAVRVVQFLPDGDQLLSFGDGGQVLLWDVARRARVREWQIDRSMVTCVAMTADGQRLAAGFSDGTTALYDLELNLSRGAYTATRVTRV